MDFQHRLLNYLDHLHYKLKYGSVNPGFIVNKLNFLDIFMSWLEKKKYLSSNHSNLIRGKIVYTIKQIEEKAINYNQGLIKPKIYNSYPDLTIMAIRLFLPFLVIIIGSLFIIAGKNKSDVNSNFQDDLKISGRLLHYQGELKDKNGQPIDKRTDVIFRLYETQDSNIPLYVGSCLGENGILPEYNGKFTILIGEDCGMKKIPESVFTHYNELYLGISIGFDEEMRPRQAIPKVGFATNSQFLAGKTLGSSTNSIPLIDEQGVLKIDAISPTIKSSSGNFVIEGEMLTLKTKDTTGNSVVIKSDKSILFMGGNIGVGKIDPKVKLDVVGDASLSGSLYFSGINSSIQALNGSDINFITSLNNTSFGSSSLVIKNNGNVGIGTLVPKEPLSVVKNISDASIIGAINLSANDSQTTSVLSLGLGVSSTAKNSSLIDFYINSTNESFGNKIGRIRVNNGGLAYETSGADFAEYFTVDDKVYLGELIGINNGKLLRATKNSHFIGVITDSAGFIGNSRMLENQQLIGLLGQVKTKVTDESGAIKAGDRVGISNLPGYGAKTIDYFQTIGLALDDAIYDQYCPSNDQSKPTEVEKKRCGQVTLFINSKWQTNMSVSPSNELELINKNEIEPESWLTDSSNELRNKLTQLVYQLKGSTIGELISANNGFFGLLKVGLLQAKNVVIDGFLLTQNLVAETLKVELLQSKKIISPIFEGEKVDTKELLISELKPRNKSGIEISLKKPENDNQNDFARLLIKGLNDQAVASIDENGNARFSGFIQSSALKAEEIESKNITSDTLSTKDASISGHLYAQNIKSENISRLEGWLTEVKNNLAVSDQQLNKLKNETATISASLSHIQSRITSSASASLHKYYSSQQFNNNLTSNTVNLEDQASTSNYISGSIKAFEFFALNKLTIGGLTVEDSTISSLDKVLTFNSLDIINFFDGKVMINNAGLLTTNDLIAEASIRTTLIEPLSNNLIINFSAVNKDQSLLSAMIFQSPDLGEVARIDGMGSAYFSKLFINPQSSSREQPIFLNAETNSAINGTTISSFDFGQKSAGQAFIPEKQQEVLIYTTSLTTDSLVFLTSQTDPANNLAITETHNCDANITKTNNCRTYFRVGAKNIVPPNQPLKFNWLIIN